MTPSLASALPMTTRCIAVSRRSVSTAVSGGSLQSKPLAERNRERRRVAGDVARELHRRWEDIVGRQCSARKTHADGFLCREVAAGQEQLSRVGEANRTRHGPMRVRVRNHAPAHVHEPVLRSCRHEPDVALHRDRHADADGMTVDGRDHRLADLPGRRTHRRRRELAGRVPPSLSSWCCERLTRRRQVRHRHRRRPPLRSRPRRGRRRWRRTTRTPARATRPSHQ